MLGCNRTVTDSKDAKLQAPHLRLRHCGVNGSWWIRVFSIPASVDTTNPNGLPLLRMKVLLNSFELIL